VEKISAKAIAPLQAVAMRPTTLNSYNLLINANNQ
jgi:hypothetical protein